MSRGLAFDEGQRFIYPLFGIFGSYDVATDGISKTIIGEFAQAGGSSRQMAQTLNPGSLIVASAYPDPPFDLMKDGSASGFDVELVRAICSQLGLTLKPVR